MSTEPRDTPIAQHEGLVTTTLPSRLFHQPALTGEHESASPPKVAPCDFCEMLYYKSAPPLRGAVVRGTRQHAPRRLMGGASSAFLAARGARGGSSCCCCSACAECSGLGCRTASAALRVAGGAGCVTTTRRLTISKTLQQTCVLGHCVV